MAMCFSEVFIPPPSCLKDKKVMILETWGKYFFSVFVFLIVIYLNFVTKCSPYPYRSTSQGRLVRGSVCNSPIITIVQPLILSLSF